MATTDQHYAIQPEHKSEPSTFTDENEFWSTKQLLDQSGTDYEILHGPQDSQEPKEPEEQETDPEQGESKTGGGSNVDENGDTPEFEGREGPEGEPTEVIDTKPVEPDTIDVDSEQEFVTDIKGVPETFVVELGGSPHIRKEGYYYLAAEMGLEIQTEPMNPTWEGDSETSAWRGLVRDGSKTWTNVGTAHLDHEDMSGAASNLDELASTRAACRALSMATGTGIASMEEMIGVDDDA